MVPKPVICQISPCGGFSQIASHILHHIVMHVVSKAGFLISSKSPSPAFRWKIWCRYEY